MLADETAVVAVGAGDEKQNLACIFHAAQPRLDVFGAGLQVTARVLLHAGEVGPGVLWGGGRTTQNELRYFDT